MGVVSMKVHHLPRSSSSNSNNYINSTAATTTGLFEPCLSLGFSNKRLRPLAPKLESSSNSSSSNTTTTTNNNNVPQSSSFDLKSFIRTSSNEKHSPPPLHPTVHPGGTRWNPTQEQIGILEMLYRGGMRTPNAQQIEQITSQLGRYGKIEGKNVFYWFQNHKARERQKLKRHNNSPNTHFRTPLPPSPFTLDIQLGDEQEIMMSSPSKRKCRSWGIQHDQPHYKQQDVSGKSSSSNSSGGEDDDEDDDEGRDRTLQLFPLHPDGTLSLSSPVNN